MESDNLIGSIDSESSKKVKCRMITLISMIIVLFALCTIFIFLYIDAKNDDDDDNDEKKEDTYIPLKLWNDGETKKKRRDPQLEKAQATVLRLIAGEKPEALRDPEPVVASADIKLVSEDTQPLSADVSSVSGDTAPVKEK